MSIHIACSEQIPAFSPAEVFDVGRRVETLPDNIRGLELKVDSEVFAKGVRVNLGIVVARQLFEINGEVVGYKKGSHIGIEGKSSAGETCLTLDLSDDEEHGGTRIDYELQLALSWKKRLAEGLVSTSLHKTVPRFAAGYQRNVVSILNQQSSTSARSRKKAA